MHTFTTIENHHNGTATVTIAPGYTDAGQYRYTIVVYDTGIPPGSVNTSFNLTVTETNQLPVLASIGDKTAHEQDHLQFTVVATDADPDSNLTLTATNLPSGATFTDQHNGSGLFDWTPDSSQANVYHNVHFEVSDGTDIDSEDITITILDGIADCSPDWQCTDWSVCADSLQTRTCTDENNCGTDAGRPLETAGCDSTAPAIVTDLR